MSNRACAWDDTSSAIRLLASPENALELQKRERFKRGLGKSGKDGHFEEDKEYTSSEKDREKNLPLHSTALHSQGYLRILVCLKRDLTKYLKTYVLVRGALKSSVRHGNTALPIGVSQYIQKFINETWLERYGSVLHQETLTLLWSVIVSLYCVGGMMGCLCSGYLNAKFGKKKCLLLNDVILIIATLHTGLSRTAKSFEMILITFYTSEIFQTANLRESIIPYVSLGVSISELISVIFCDQFLWMRYCSVILIFLFIIAYGIGPAGAASSVYNEIFTLSTRASAFVIGGMVIWLGLTFTGMIFPFAVMLLGPFCFLIFIAVLIISAVLIYMFLPETKGKSISEITEEFKTRQFKKKRHQAVEVQYQGLFQMIAVLGIGGTFQIGFQISSLTYISQHVKAFINETWLERYGYPIQQDNLLFLWSITVSIFGIGGLLGSSGSRYLTVKYGKKKCLLCNNLLMIVAASIMGFSKIAQSFEMILIGRFMCGISAALAQLVTLPFFPESPPYLLMHKGDQEGCKKAIRQLWGEGHHQAEIDDIMKEKTTMKNTKILSVLELVKEPAFRWQLYMIVILTATIQLCGINAIYFYTSEVLQAAGFDERMVSYMTLSIGLSELVAAVVCSSIIERLGRKTLLRGGYWIMGSLLACITVTLSLQDWYFWMPYCSLCLIILFVVVFAVGPGGATISTRVEIFKLSCRPPAFVISAVLNWLGMFVIGTTFPFIVVQFRGLYQMILVLGIGGSFPYGFHISVINYPSVHIRKFINETWIERHGSPLHPETIMLLWSFIVSVYGIGGLLGCLFCTYVTTKYRKKKCQIFTNLIMLAAALFMAFSKTAKSFEMILVGRLLYGIGSGFSMNIHPQYVGEISPKKLRGFANSTVAVFLTLGKLTGQVIGLRINISKDKIPESFTGELTRQLSKALDKPAQYLAIQISPDQMMSFGGSADPSAMCFLYSIGKIGEQENKVYSKLLCDLLNKELKIPSDRIYVSFFNISAGNVGWNNTTFA
ncbi:hypothetical protein BTVI_09990 [Pitangus sulphuratus]|nr:hypothetical protein BTVI_09990 [Pitangus sulphuratus]